MEESKHFLYYCSEPDKKCLEDLEPSLESDFGRITADLKYRPSDKTKVIIYPNIKTFHSAIATAADDSIIGTGVKGAVKIVSPLNPRSIHGYDDVIKAASHEFTHSVLCGINTRLPLWLGEGVSVYEAKQMDDSDKRSIKAQVRRIHPTFRGPLKSIKLCLNMNETIISGKSTNDHIISSSLLFQNHAAGPCGMME